MTSYKYCILTSIILAQLVRQKSPLVEIEQGLVQGVLSENGQYYEFLGIPYATTSFKTRFQAPQPLKPWNGIYEATNDNIRCPQRILGKYVLGKEDCLTLNVYAPVKKPIQDGLPVMVYIHGGGFFEGSSNPIVYGPEYIVRHDVILVAINYRLNIQGFLCLHIKEAPGNAGLKDQIAALKWVQKNIRSFGGDPNKVTVFGESAGGMSVSILLLSLLTKGLIHKAIMQSGSSLSPAAFQVDPISTASKLARSLGYNTKNPQELYDIFMNHTDEELITTRAQRPKGNVLMSELLFVPCIEKEIPGVEALITEPPIRLLSSGTYNHVPVIIGYNNLEAYFFLPRENNTMIDEMHVYGMLPSDLVFENEDDKKNVANRLSDHYFHGQRINERPKTEIANFCSDVYFIYPCILESEMLAKTSEEKIYSYIFEYDGLLNIPKLLSRNLHLPGAVHADELFYIFKPGILPFLQFLEYNTIYKVTKMWTDFAKSGNPTPNQSDAAVWVPSTKSNHRFLIIDKDSKMSTYKNKESITLWNTTYNKFRRQNYDSV